VDDWAWLLDAQHGIVDRSQARQARISPDSIKHRLKTGQWRREYWSVYATFSGQAPREAMLWAALKRAGPGAMLSHETAAEVHRLIDKPSTKIHITVPASRRPAQTRPIPRVVIHRSDQCRPQPVPPWVLPRSRVEDTVLDLVASASTFDDAYSWISRALSRRLTTAGLLRTTLAARTRVRWRAWLTAALDDADEGIHFPLERHYVRNVERPHGLPKAHRQAKRLINGSTHYKDNWYADFGVCVELDGLAYHPPEQTMHDKHRDNLNLAADDARTFRFGWVDVTERACDSAAMVAASLRRGGWKGMPRSCRRPGCTLGAGATVS
jgi:hypothetical protein